MGYEFTNEPPEPETKSSSRQKARPEVKDTGADFLELRDPVEPPAGLMRKRPHIIVWLAIALFLGGLIALALIGFGSG